MFIYFKKVIFILLLFVLSANVIFAQFITKKSYSISHPVKFGNENKFSTPKKFITVPDTLNIVAIMVQFQEDSDPRSTGNGKFDTSNTYYNPIIQRDTVIDSPPYDSSYFADHLEFLKNYYFKSSKGKLIVNYKVFGHVFTLPQQMQNYSPQKNENNQKLAQMFVDAWSRADSLIDFSSYDTNKTAFVMFHAGVGRDIDLTIFGYDPTPFDIPSVFLGLNNLQEIFGVNYNGFVTRSGFAIKNSLMIPSTEIRNLDLTSGNVLLQLGMNGILVASFGSYIGLPDLFNTQSGKTSIGRFGLMDGQSIFSFNGIFPPEPSAWEKIYLGWVSPITISNGDSFYKVKTSSVDNPSDSTMFKVLMNSKEYFLIENRNRDADNNGQVVYTHNRAFHDSTKFTQDVPGFVYYDIYNVNGNLTDVKYLDWSLPGDITDTSNYRGGILIWHIDENIIDANIATNSINNDINHRGVKVMEAKGSQDIGITVSTAFGDVTGDGFFVDFWYNGNHYVPSTIYQNQFTPNTYPNTLSYSLVNSNIYFTNFDSIGPEMKFRVKIGSDIIKPISGFPKFIGIPTGSYYSEPVCFDINNDGRDEIFVNNGTDLFGYKTTGSNIIDSSYNGLLIKNFGHMPPAFANAPSFTGSNRLISSYVNFSGNSYSTLGFFNYDNNFVLTDTVFDTFLNTVISAPVLAFDSNKVIVGFNNNKIYERKLNGQPSGFVDSSKTGSINFFTKLDNNRFSYSSGGIAPNSFPKFIVTGNIINSSSVDTVTIVDGKHILLDGNQINFNFQFDNITSFPTLADINKDGRQEIIFCGDNKLYAVNSSGVLLENFPVKINSDVSSGIAVADVNNDGIFDLIFVSSVGDLYAYGINGKIVTGYPVKTGIPVGSTPALANLNDTLGIVVYGRDGYLYAYKTNTKYDESKILWKNFLKDKYLSNNNFKSVSSSVIYTEKLPSNKVYNWPNPVYDSKTFIRYYLNGNTTSVTIKILDLSGELVTKLTGTAHSFADNEIIWDVSTVQSGVYYGVVQATIDGSTETKIIKIAVVK